MQKKWLFACGAGILITVLFWADLLKPLDALWTGALFRMRNSATPLRTNSNIVLITAPPGGAKALTIEEQALLGEKSKVSSLIGAFMEKAHPAVAVFLLPVRAADPAFQGQDFILFPSGGSKNPDKLHLERPENSPGMTAYARSEERLELQVKPSWPSSAYAINYRGLADRSPFAEYSILDVLQDQLPADRVKGKIVFVADPLSEKLVKTPIGNLPPERVEAQICANLLEKDFLVRADRTGLGQLAIPVLILLLALGFPSWGPLERFGHWAWSGCLGGIMVGGLSIPFFTSSLSFGVTAPLLALAVGHIVIRREKMDPGKELEKEIKQGFLDVLQNTLLQKDAVRCLNYFLRTIVGSGRAHGALLVDVYENRFEVRARWGAMPSHCQVNQEAWQKVISSMVPALFTQKDLPGLKEAHLAHLLSIPLPTMEGKPSLLLHIGFSQLPAGEQFRQVLTQAALLGLSLSEYRFGTHVQFTSDQLGDQYMSVVKNLAIVLDARDPFTFGRSERVAETSAKIAQHVGLDDGETQKIHMAGLLHNVGEVGIREEILRKEGKLTQEEWTELKRHPHISAQILSPLEHLQDIIPAIRHHHERWDGKGYPNGLAGDQIPLGARILAIADTYEAMTSKRRFRESFTSKRAMEEIKKCAGTQFDPDLVMKIFFDKGDGETPFKARSDCD